MNKFNPKIDQNKPKVWTPVAGANLISRLWVWNEEKSEYREPAGNRYLARRHELNDGKKKLGSSMHETLEAARQWQRSELKPAKAIRSCCISTCNAFGSNIRRYCKRMETPNVREALQFNATEVRKLPATAFSRNHELGRRAIHPRREE